MGHLVPCFRPRIPQRLRLRAIRLLAVSVHTPFFSDPTLFRRRSYRVGSVGGGSGVGGSAGWDGVLPKKRASRKNLRNWGQLDKNAPMMVESPLGAAIIEPERKNRRGTVFFSGKGSIGSGRPSLVNSGKTRSFWASKNDFWAPTKSFWAPKIDFWAPTKGFWAPKNDFWVPTKGLSESLCAWATERTRRDDRNKTQRS